MLLKKKRTTVAKISSKKLGSQASITPKARENRGRLRLGAEGGKKKPGKRNQKECFRTFRLLQWARNTSGGYMKKGKRIHPLGRGVPIPLQSTKRTSKPSLQKKKLSWWGEPKIGRPRSLKNSVENVHKLCKTQPSPFCQ